MAGKDTGARQTAARRAQPRRGVASATPAGAKLSILAVGCLVNQSATQTTQFSSNATFLDYDVVIWDPQSTVDEYAPRELYQGLPCLSQNKSPQFSSDVTRRRDEFAHMLELGRAIVVFAPDQHLLYTYTGQSTTSGTGRNAKVTNFVVERDTLSALPFKMTVVAAAGSRAEVRAGEPFRTFWAAVGQLLHYRAYVDVPRAVPLLAITGTERIVAALLRAGRGFVLVLPAPYWGSHLENEKAKAAESAELAVVEAIGALVEDLRRETGDFKLPEWSEAYALPGEAQKRGAIAEREAARDRLLQEIDEQKRAMAILEQRKILFTGSGVALEVQAKNAFRALGFEVKDSTPGRDDFIATRAEQAAVVEVKGVSKSAAEKHAAQLEKWVAGYYEEHGRQPKGVLVVNAYAETPIADRPEASFPDQMLPYAVGRGHALVTGLQLLGAWLDVEAHPERADELADSLLAAIGTWDRYADWRLFLGGGVATTRATSGK